MGDKNCPICGKEKEKIKNKYCSYACRNVYINSRKDYKKQSKNVSKGVEKSLVKKLGEKKPFEVICSKCEKPFEVIEREKKFPTKKKYFCSRSCANSRKPSQETKDKISKKLKGVPTKNGEWLEVLKKCLNCGNEFVSKRKNKCCSRICSSNKRKNESLKNKNIKDIYKKLSEFKFSLNDYPDEFNFELINEYGWYKAKNRGDNLNGVSRDHIISVTGGYEKMINPILLSHPVNCELIRHNDNVSKGKAFGMSIDELIDKIKKWNIKYNEDFKIDDIYIDEDFLRNYKFK